MTFLCCVSSASMSSCIVDLACGFEYKCFLHARNLPCTFHGEFASAERSYSVPAILRRLPPASLIGGPALSDCISGPAGTQHGLNTQERWDRIGGVQWGRSESGKERK